MTTGWLLDPDVAYLNHGAFGALAEPVAAAALEHRRRMELNPANLMMRTLGPQLDSVRSRLAEFLNADEAGCVFVANATSGTATVLAALAATLDPGDEVLTTDHRYGAVALQLTALMTGLDLSQQVVHVPIDAPNVAAVVGPIIDGITDRTRLLVIDSIASASGFMFPVAEIVAAAHNRGVPVLVDAAHAPGQIDVDLTAIDADFWVGNLHKWICSPRAAAILSVAPRWRDEIRPLVASHHYAEGYRPAFDWTGTFDPVNILAVPAALDYWDAIGWDSVRATQRSLVDDGARRVAAALGTSSPAHEEFRAAIRVIDLGHTLTYDQARHIESELSTRHKIEVSLSKLHGRDWVRVCGQIYNTAGDYDRLAVALPGLLEAE